MNEFQIIMVLYRIYPRIKAFSCKDTHVKAMKQYALQTGMVAQQNGNTHVFTRYNMTKITHWKAVSECDIDGSGTSPF